MLSVHDTKSIYYIQLSARDICQWSLLRGLLATQKKTSMLLFNQKLHKNAKRRRQGQQIDGKSVHALFLCKSSFNIYQTEAAIVQR